MSFQSILLKTWPVLHLGKQTNSFPNIATLFFPESLGSSLLGLEY